MDRIRCDNVAVDHLEPEHARSSPEGFP